MESIEYNAAKIENGARYVDILNKFYNDFRHQPYFRHYDSKSYRFSIPKPIQVAIIAFLQSNEKHLLPTVPITCVFYYEITEYNFTKVVEGYEIAIYHEDALMMGDRYIFRLK